MKDEVHATIKDGQVVITVPADRMFNLLRFQGRHWTQSWWEQYVSPVVWDAMARAVASGEGNATGEDVL